MVSSSQYIHFKRGYVLHGDLLPPRMSSIVQVTYCQAWLPTEFGTGLVAIHLPDGIVID